MMLMVTVSGRRRAVVGMYGRMGWRTRLGLIFVRRMCVLARWRDAFRLEDTVRDRRDSVSADGTGECLQPAGGFVCGAGAWVDAGRDCAGAAAGAQVPGRFEVVPSSNDVTVVVDYAHTDDALRNLISLARELVKERGGRVITLFGCGGDRDRTKRPRMGRAAGEGSDLVVLTSDNPRSEEPMAIIEEALVGVKETGTSVLSRRIGRGRLRLRFVRRGLGILF